MLQRSLADSALPKLPGVLSDLDRKLYYSWKTYVPVLISHRALLSKKHVVKENSIWTNLVQKGPMNGSIR